MIFALAGLQNRPFAKPLFSSRETSLKCHPLPLPIRNLQSRFCDSMLFSDDDISEDDGAGEFFLLSFLKDFFPPMNAFWLFRLAGAVKFFLIRKILYFCRPHVLWSIFSLFLSVFLFICALLSHFSVHLVPYLSASPKYLGFRADEAKECPKCLKQPKTIEKKY